MKKYFTVFLFLLTACFSTAGVSFITVSDEEQYSKTSDFSNTYELNVNEHGQNQIAKCQTVRLDKNWYITAAHCITPMCDKACSMRVRLVIGPNYEMDVTTTHVNSPDSDAGKRVFKHPKATIISGKNAAYDIALLYFPSANSKYVFSDPSKNTAISENLFIKRIPDYNIYYKAANGTNIPMILSIDTKMHRIIDRKLSVASIWSGKKSVLQTVKPVFYSPNLHYLYTENFGIIKGISGSGVMTNTGELIGIVSATADLSVVSNGVEKKSIPIAFLAAFDDYVMDFIKLHIDNISYTVTDKNYYKPVPDQFKTMISAVDKIGQDMNLK